MRKIFSFWVIVLVVLSSMQLSAKKYTWGGKKSSDFFDSASAKIEKLASKDREPVLNRLYREMFYAPIWVKSTGLSPFGKSLIAVIEEDNTVTPSVKFYEEIKSVSQKIDNLISKKGGNLSDKVALEMAMSKLYSHYARYRVYGGISWNPFMRKLDELTEDYKIKVGWEKYAPPSGPAALLDNALAEGSLKRAFLDADPKRFHYRELRSYLIRYINISKRGGWPTLPKFGTLKPGASNAKVVPLIRKHLSIVGDLQGCSEPMSSPKYDDCLVKAVKRFQLRHGLKGDGIIGRGARSALNQTVTQAIQKIRLNLDRIKWLNREEKDMRIELNIPSFRLNFFDREKLVTTIRVVTGKPNHPTPIFHNVMKYIVVNPWWKIPESIVRHEMLPKLIRDPYHYESQGKEVHTSWDESSPRVDPGTVKWSKYKDNKKKIPYYFMQVPSRHNALGKIKFLFPNGFQVYIHDTPSKSLFFRNVRAFSHGCMRIQKPRELLESLALFNDNIDVDGVMKRLEGTEKKTIVLKHYIPIDITYLTAFVDPYGNLNFRKDIYKYDRYQMKKYATQAVSLNGLPIKKVQKKQSPKKAKQKISRSPSREKALAPKKVTTDKKIPKSTPVKKNTTKKPSNPKKTLPPKKETAEKVAKGSLPKGFVRQADIIEASKALEKAEEVSLPKDFTKQVELIKASKYTKRKKDIDGYSIVEIYDN